MKFVQEIIFLFKETCLIFFTTLFIYCGPFLVGVHVCFGTHNAARVSKLLLWLINEHISVLVWPVLRIYIEMNFSCVGLCVCPLFFFSFLAF